MARSISATVGLSGAYAVRSADMRSAANRGPTIRKKADQMSAAGFSGTGLSVPSSMTG